MVSRAILNGWPLIPPSRLLNRPVNLVAPAISGTPTVGQTLTMTDGTWDGFPSLVYTRQWLRDGAPIAGVTGSTYVLVDADAGHVISAAVTVQNAFGGTTAVSSGYGIQGGGGPALLQMNDRMVVDGDSETQGTTNNSVTWVNPFTALNRGRLYLPVGYMKAVGGSTIASVAGRVSNVLALNPKIVGLLVGTNNLPGSTDATVIFNALKAVVQSYLDGGVPYVIVGKIFPRQIGGTSIYSVITPAEELIRQQVNTMIDTLASARVKIVDIEPGFDIATDLVADGLHTSWKGAIKYATAFNAAVTAIMAAGDPLTTYFPDAAKNVLRAANKNAVLSGIGGTKGTANVTGEIADGWTVTENGGMTVLCSKVDNGDGTYGQRIQVSGTSSGNGKTVLLTNSVSGMASYGSVGDYFEQLTQIDLASGGAGLGTMELFGTLGVTPWASAYTPNLGQAFSGVFRTSPSGTLNGSTYAFNCGLVFAAGAVAADFTLSRPVLQKLPFLPA
jgi:hypothetical protein